MSQKQSVKKNQRVMETRAGGVAGGFTCLLHLARVLKPLGTLCKVLNRQGQEDVGDSVV